VVIKILQEEILILKLLRTSDAEGNEKIKIQIPDTSFHGTIDFKRFKVTMPGLKVK